MNGTMVIFHGFLLVHQRVIEVNHLLPVSCPAQAAPWSVLPCWASAGVPGSCATPAALGPTSAVQRWCSSTGGNGGEPL